MAIIFYFITAYLIILEVKTLKKSYKYAMFILLQLLNSQICLIYVLIFLFLILEPFKTISQTLNSSVFCLLVCLFFRYPLFQMLFDYPEAYMSSTSLSLWTTSVHMPTCGCNSKPTTTPSWLTDWHFQWSGKHHRQLRQRRLVQLL